MATAYEQTTSNLVKNKDLSIQQKAVIKKALLIDGILEKGVFGQFAGEESFENGHSSVTFRKLVIPELEASDIKYLEEGMTPEGAKLTYREYSVATKDYGEYIEYTDASVKYNFDDVVSDARAFLGEHARQTKELRMAEAFLATTRVIALGAGTDTLSKITRTLAKAKNQLKKNGAKPVNGSRYVCIAPVEFVTELALLSADKFDSSEKNDILKEGYVGSYMGFDFYEDVRGVAGANLVFFGNSTRGRAVKDIKIGSGNLDVYSHPLGSVAQAIKNATGEVIDVRADHLNQRGSVGYKVMGTMPTIVEDGMVFKCDITGLGIEIATKTVEGETFGSVSKVGESVSPKEIA